MTEVCYRKNDNWDFEVISVKDKNLISKTIIDFFRKKYIDKKKIDIIETEVINSSIYEIQILVKYAIL